MMNRTFISHIILLVLINLLIKPIYVLIIDVEVQNTLGTEVYGLYFALFNFSYILQIIADLGINNYNNKHLAQHPEQARQYISQIIVIKILLGVIFAISAVILFLVVGYDMQHLPLLGIILLNQFLMGLVLYYRGNLTALQRYGANAWLSALDKLILILLLGYVLYIHPDQLTVERFALAQSASIGLTLVVAVMLLRSYYVAALFSLDWTFVQQLIRRSLPFAMIILLMTAYTRIDAVMLERLLDDDAHAAGVYAASYRLLDAANMIAFLFAGLLLPMLASLINRPTELDSLICTSLTTILSGAIPLSAFMHFYHVPVLDTFYDAASAEYYSTMAYLFPSFLAICVGYIYGTLATAGDRLSSLNWIFALAVLINVVLNFWLIPSFASTGAAMATLTTQVLVTIAQIAIAYRYFDLSLGANIILRIALYSLIAMLVFYGFSHMAMSWYMALAIGMIALLLTAIALRLLDLKVFIQ